MSSLSCSTQNFLPWIILSLPQSPIPAYNKDYQILIKIKHKFSSISLIEKLLEKLTDIVNVQLKKSKVIDKNIQMVKILLSRNLLVQVVNNREKKKLETNLDQVQGLGDTRIIIKFFGMISYNISLCKIDIKKKAIIWYLTRKNKNTFFKLTMLQISWLKTLIGEKTIGLLILKVTNSVIANRMIYKKIVYQITNACLYFI